MFGIQTKTRVVDAHIIDSVCTRQTSRRLWMLVILYKTPGIVTTTVVHNSNLGIYDIPSRGCFWVLPFHQCFLLHYSFSNFFSWLERDRCVCDSHCSWRLEYSHPIPSPPPPLLTPWRVMRSYRRHLEERDPFETMTGRTAFIDDLLAEVFRGFLQL